MAVGLTVIVNVIGVTTQPAATGVTVMVATSGPVVPLVAVNGAMSPVPDAANPIAGVLLVQLNTVPGEPANGINSVVALLQYILLAIGVAAWAVLTVIVNVIGTPVQVVPPLV